MAIPRMSKRHFKYIATAIYNCEFKGYDGVIQAISDALALTNPRFSPEYFEAICYGITVENLGVAEA